MDDLSTRRTEDRLRAALRDRAALVDPEDRLDEILEAAGSAPRRRWVPLVAAAAVAGLVGTVWALDASGPQDPQPTSVAGTPTPSATPTPTGSPSPTASPSPTSTATAAPLPVYVISSEVLGEPDGRFGLRREWRQSTRTDEEGRVRDAVAASLAATVPGVEPGPWDGVEVSSVAVGADAVTLTLTGRPRTTGTQADDLALPAVGWTAQAVLGRGNLPVTVRADGAELGVVTRPPADETYAVLADVWVTAPLDGARVPESRPVVVTGEASVFEATLTWELQRDGAPVSDGFVTASAGAPARGTYEIDLGTLSAGTYRMSVTSLSPRDGAVDASDVVTFTVG